MYARELKQQGKPTPQDVPVAPQIAGEDGEGGADQDAAGSETFDGDDESAQQDQDVVMQDS
jgi:hypothetical protein